jgi:hypothetical protein
VVWSGAHFNKKFQIIFHPFYVFGLSSACLPLWRSEELEETQLGPIDLSVPSLASLGYEFVYVLVLPAAFLLTWTVFN